METSDPKPGPVPRGYVDIRIDLPRALRDWPWTRSRGQPEGVSALVRRLLAAEQRRRQASKESRHG